MHDTQLSGTSVNRPVHSSVVQSLDFVVEKELGLLDFVSMGLFYRYIHRPIERTTHQFRRNEDMYILQNSDRALSYGFEAEARKHLFANLQFTASCMLSYSSVIGKRTAMIIDRNNEYRFIETTATQKRPLSGQMPYLVNAGIHYFRKNLTANILFNRSGRQLFVLGESAYRHEYRAPFNSLETSVSYRFPRSGILLKLSALNILNSAQIFYTNNENDYVRDEYNFATDNLLPRKTENYDRHHDPIVYEVKNGQTFSLSISRRF